MCVGGRQESITLWNGAFIFVSGDRLDWQSTTQSNRATQWNLLNLPLIALNKSLVKVEDTFVVGHEADEMEKYPMNDVQYVYLWDFCIGYVYIW